MTSNLFPGDRVTDTALTADPERLQRLFGDPEGLLPLWIAEPYVDLAPEIKAVLEDRASAGWYGYETRPAAVLESFWDWMTTRHGTGRV